MHCLSILVKYVGGYHGLLSGVTVRPGSVEPHSVVECLYACREGLDFGDLETLGSGMKVKISRSGKLKKKKSRSEIDICVKCTNVQLAHPFLYYKLKDLNESSNQVWQVVAMDT